MGDESWVDEMRAKLDQLELIESWPIMRLRVKELEAHIAGLEAQIRQKNERIAQLEAQLENTQGRNVNNEWKVGDAVNWVEAGAGRKGWTGSLRSGTITALNGTVVTVKPAGKGKPLLIHVNMLRKGER